MTLEERLKYPWRSSPETGKEWDFSQNAVDVPSQPHHIMTQKASPINDNESQPKERHRSSEQRIETQSQQPGHGRNLDVHWQMNG